MSDIYIHIRIYTHIHIRIYIYIYVYIHIYIYVCVCVYKIYILYNESFTYKLHRTVLHLKMRIGHLAKNWPVFYAIRRLNAVFPGARVKPTN
jgi:hypothetical protein